MAHRYDIYHLFILKHVADYAVVPDANAPQILKSPEFATA